MKTKNKKSPVPATRLLAGIVLLLAIAVICLTGALMDTRHSVERLQETVDANRRMATNGLIGSMALEKAVTDPVGQQVYLPEFRIKLPLNSVTKALAYSLRNDVPGSPAGPLEADVTSTKYLPPEGETRIDCSNLVRLKFENQPHPYNAHEKVTSVTLDSGKTLQVYESQNESECENSWNNTVSPAAVAAEFRQARSY
jgi:hypothetical protein